ncbi:MAG: S41 family peptidase [Prevotellaceae bacterium]|nr:S41 family peptidase [Prevotellaceae bacterium]
MKKNLSVLLFVLWTALPVAAQHSAHNFEVKKNLEIFNALYRQLDLNFVDTLSADRQVGDAVRYMLSRLDPYTEYFAESETDNLRQLSTGKYAGIGSVISYNKKADRCQIAQPYADMPAAEAGLRPGDIILELDGKAVPPCGATPVADYTSDISSRLRGEPGTTLTLRVSRPSVDRELTFSLVRRTVAIPNITLSTLLADSVAYICLDGFTEDCVRQVRAALVALKARGARSLVLDLRSNGGGLVDEAVRLVNLFVPRGREVVSTRGKVKAAARVYRTEAEPFDLDMPIVVLTDYGTASSAEIACGALQDYDRAVLVGRNTYGKGLVQSPVELPYGAMLKLTTGKYYIPSGRCVQAYKYKDGRPQQLPDSLARRFRTAGGRTVYDAGGVHPDVEVEADSLPNLLHYLEASDELAEWCARYRNTHADVPPAAQLRISDDEYSDFTAFVLRSGFDYDRISLSMLADLRRMAEFEGYGEVARAEIDSLEARLRHNEAHDFEHWKPQIKRLVENTLAQYYYYQAGMVENALASDPDVAEALRILADRRRYAAILRP